MLIWFGYYLLYRVSLDVRKGKFHTTVDKLTWFLCCCSFLIATRADRELAVPASCMFYVLSLVWTHIPCRPEKWLLTFVVVSFLENGGYSQFPHWGKIPKETSWKKFYLLTCVRIIHLFSVQIPSDQNIFSRICSHGKCVCLPTTEFKSCSRHVSP